MDPQERRSQIARLVTERGRQSVDALAAAFAVSAETIRRDLARLAEDGVVRKVHGGATQPRLHAESSFAERMSEDWGAKAAIGAALTRLVRPGETLFIDTGSTTLAAATALARVEQLTVITNCSAIAAIFAKVPHHRAFLIGGAFRADNAECVGPLAIEQIGRFEADHAILTVAAVDAEAGATDSDFDEAQIARAMISHAQTTIVLATAAKFGRRAGFSVCRIPDIDTLVTDVTPRAELAAVLHQAGVSVIAADTGQREATPFAPRAA